MMQRFVSYLRARQNPLGTLLAPLERNDVWTTLGWLEIVKSYRRTFFGPVWITLNITIFATAMTLVYGVLFGVPTKEYAAYLVCGMMAWFWFTGVVIEAGNSFQVFGGYLRSMPVDKTYFIWASASKQIIVLAHHSILYFILIALGVVKVSLSTLWALPSIAILFVLSIPAAAILSILYARYRDLEKLVSSSLIVFLMLTPIFWQPGMMSGWRTAVFHLNPVYYLVEFLRRPLLGMPFEPLIALVILGMTAALWVFAVFFYARYQRYVVFWI